MNKPVSHSLCRSLISIFINNVDWHKLDATTLQKFYENPKQTGRQLTRLLEEGLKFSEEDLREDEMKKHFDAQHGGGFAEPCL